MIPQDQIDLLSKHGNLLLPFYKRIHEVHKRPLHEAQIKMAKAFFIDGKKIIQSQWGRSTGKSECVCYLAWMQAILYPGSEILIVLPEKDQAKKIYWRSRRLQSYGPPEWLDGDPSVSDLTVNFKNGSTISLEGAKNYDALRGVKPHLVFYDEFQNHIAEFDKEVMRPNLIGKNSALIVTGTPPKLENCYYYEFKNALLEAIKSGDDSRCYLQFPTWCNPIMDKGELDKVKNQLIKQGDIAIWKREYCAEDCFGGKDVVFPPWERKRHVKPHALLMEVLDGQKEKIEWWVAFDPGTSVCFAVLFIAYIPSTGQIFVMDEIYEKDRKYTDTRTIWGRSSRIEKELARNAVWHRVYDEREAWFPNEVRGSFPGEKVSMRPTRKQKSKAEDQISAMKMLMAAEDMFFVSDKCSNFIWETENYVTDDNGQLIDKNDHLLDDCRYILDACKWKFVERAPQLRVVANQESNYGDKSLIVEPIKLTEDWSEKAVSDSMGFYGINDYFDF